jgi:GntR family transcriptional regulator, histidine utilization repressor
VTGWQEIAARALGRIHARDWPPGAVIPHEAALAAEWGVARATVNRALQSLAEAGWLDRRRKAGTRVALFPVRKATLSIPVLRVEVEALGQAYRHDLLSRALSLPPPEVAHRMGLPASHSALHLTALHRADGAGYAHEDRWVNPDAVPGLLTADLTGQSANEWLVSHALFTHGDYDIAASPAGALAALFDCAPETPLLTIRRGTWNGPATGFRRRWDRPGLGKAAGAS